MHKKSYNFLLTMCLCISLPNTKRPLHNYIHKDTYKQQMHEFWHNDVSLLEDHNNEISEQNVRPVWVPLFAWCFVDFNRLLVCLEQKIANPTMGLDFFATIIMMVSKTIKLSKYTRSNWVNNEVSFKI